MGTIYIDTPFGHGIEDAAGINFLECAPSAEFPLMHPKKAYNRAVCQPRLIDTAY
jgi:hypothetical protein